jgi:hypothetical protein
LNLPLGDQTPTVSAAMYPLAALPLMDAIWWIPASSPKTLPLLRLTWLRFPDASQIVLVGCGLAVEAVVAIAVAMPHVDRRAGHRVPARRVANRQPDFEADTGSGSGGRAEAGADVATHDAGVIEDVDSVRTVAGVGPGGFVGNLNDVPSAAAAGGRTRRA